jgi:hypothetical protein
LAYYASYGGVYFEFYDQLGNVESEAYITLGQLDALCISLSKNTVVVTALASPLL